MAGSALLFSWSSVQGKKLLYINNKALKSQNSRKFGCNSKR
jgi:hypothetical protein